MAVLEAPERHQDLVEELLAEVAAYNPDVDREAAGPRLRIRREGARGSAAPLRRGLHPPPVRRRQDLRRAEARRRDDRRRALHDVVEDTEVTIEQVRDEFGDEIAHLVEGVTKLTGIQLPEP